MVEIPEILFDEHVPGDSAPCFYCGLRLTWNDMRPTAWGEPYRENVCADCRAEEVANRGWMTRTEADFIRRAERNALKLSS